MRYFNRCTRRNSLRKQPTFFHWIPHGINHWKCRKMWGLFLGYRENEIEHHLLCNGCQSESKMPLIDPEESAKYPCQFLQINFSLSQRDCILK